MPNPALLSVEGLTIKFGGLTALGDVSFKASGDAITAIIGPNGAGKTTLFNSVSCINRPTEGRVMFGDTDLADVSPSGLASIGIGRTFQNLGLIDVLDPVENILLGRHRRMSNGFWASALNLRSAVAEESRNRDRAAEIAAFLGLAEFVGRPCGTLPYGARKMVELGRALAMEPALLLLDEPVAGMNLEETERMAGIIHRIRRQFGTAILLVEHDMAFVMDLADHVVALNFGVVIGEGSPEAVRQMPRVIEAYLGVGAA